MSHSRKISLGRRRDTGSVIITLSNVSISDKSCSDFHYLTLPGSDPNNSSNNPQCPKGWDYRHGAPVCSQSSKFVCLFVLVSGINFGLGSGHQPLFLFLFVLLLLLLLLLFTVLGIEASLMLNKASTLPRAKFPGACSGARSLSLSLSFLITVCMVGGCGCQKTTFKNRFLCRTWWCISLILVLGRQRQEISLSSRLT